MAAEHMCGSNKHVSPADRWRAAVEAFQHYLLVCGMDLSAWMVSARVMEPAVYILRCSLHNSTRVSSPPALPLPPPPRSLPPPTSPSFADNGAPARVCTRWIQTFLTKRIDTTTDQPHKTRMRGFARNARNTARRFTDATGSQRDKTQAARETRRSLSERQDARDSAPERGGR